MIFFIVIVISIVIGYICGGRLKGLLTADIKGLWLPIIAFLLDYAPQYIIRLVPGAADFGWAFVTGQYILLLLFVLINLFDPAFCLFGLGTVANFLVIALNGFKMPVDISASGAPAEQIEQVMRRLNAGEIYGYAAANENTMLAPLGDVILIPGLGGFASVGDLLLFAGIAYMVIRGMYRWREGENSRRAFAHSGFSDK